MNTIDYCVLFLYMVGLVGVAFFFYKRNRNASDMFNASGQSPWWVSGLSAFMTMFSAGTFVVWGGIAFRYGATAIAISMCYGISAFIVGRFIAAIWKRTGTNSAPEYLKVRFGKSLVQFYTWLQGVITLFTLGGSIYALAVVVAALVELPPGHLLANPVTGNLSVDLFSILICCVVILIAMGGGLWAVLMTDVLQFIILSVAVLMVVPLILIKAGGIETFINAAPEGFFSPVSGDFTWYFLTGWIVVHAFKIGGEWAFVQRFTCVPDAASAKKSAYLFGAMYIISPVFWMLPPMIFRTIDPEANYEEAYILACQYVLPSGLLGLIVAAMISATSSMATTMLNVYAGAFTTEFYRSFINPNASEKKEVFVARMITIMLGAIVISGTLAIPRLGTLTDFIIALTSLVTGPLVLPAIWGLFSRKIGLKAAWATTVISIFLGVIVKFGFLNNGWFVESDWAKGILLFLNANTRVTELALGIITPLLILTVFECSIRKTSKGWNDLASCRAAYRDQCIAGGSVLPAVMCAYALLWLGLILSVSSFFVSENSGLLIGYATLLFVLGGGIFLAAKRGKSPQVV